MFVKLVLKIWLEREKSIKMIQKEEVDGVSML